MSSGYTSNLIVFMPDRQPAPFFLTKDEAIQLLRLDESGARFTSDSFDRIRERYGLRGVQLGKTVRFRLPDVLAVAEKIMESTPR